MEDHFKDGRALIPVTLTRRDLCLVMMVVVLWGFHAPIMKLGVSTIEPLSLNFIRFFLTGLIFLPFAGKVSWATIKLLLPVTFFFVCGNLMLAHLALAHITANSFIVLIQTAQPITLILAWMLFGERFGLYTVAGIVVAFSGLLIVFGAPDISAAPIGGLLTLFSALAWSFGSLAMKRTGQIKPTQFIAYSYLMASPVALLSTWLLEDGQVEGIMAADPFRLGFVVFYQVIVMAIMSVVWARLMSRNPAQFVTPFLLLQPIFGVVASYFINGETLNWNVMLGGLAVLAGIGIINWRAIIKRRTPAAGTVT